MVEIFQKTPPIPTFLCNFLLTNESSFRTQQRLKVFPSVNECISCAAFNTQGNIFAYAKSYDWGKGASGYRGPQAQPNGISLHYVPEEEIKQRQKKGGKR